MVKQTDDHRPCEYAPCGAIDSTHCSLLPPDGARRPLRRKVKSARDSGCRVARFVAKGYVE